MGYKNSVFRTFALVSQLGISIICPVLLCAMGGMWLEERISLPVTVPLLLLGLAAGLRNAWYLVRHATEDRKEADSGKEDKKDGENR